MKFYSTDELKSILEALDAFWSQFFKTLYLTGMRKDELVQLKWENVDLEKSQINIVQTKTKINRIIPMHEEVKNILLARVGIHPVLVFTSPNANTKLGVDKPYHAIKKVLDKLGLEGDVHKMRHTFASHLVMNGVSLQTVAELLGHTDIETTKIYAHLSPDFKANAVSKLQLPI